MRSDRYSQARNGLGPEVNVVLTLSRRDHSRGLIAYARPALLTVLALLVGLAAFVAPATATAATRAVSYRGYRIAVPASWPVFHLTARSTVCVRFNRHALYLGSPGSRQRCPAHAAGHTEAILVAPLAAAAASARGGAAPALAPVTVAGAQSAQGSETQLAIAAHSVRVTATWGRNPKLVQRALGVKKLSVSAPATSSPPPPARSAVASAAGFRTDARSSAVPHTGTVFTGDGFDACSTPSTTQMTAWSASPYRALGVYIGGANMACSQTNLTSAWVGQEWAAGWHLIPTYVGLQAPSNSCGCAAITPSQATTEGTDAAIDAVTHAQAVGIGTGNPIYFDLESYTRGGSRTSSVLAFLSAWTTQLHADGYGSGVYSSADSGIADLASQYGTGYAEPDDIWIARWNDEQSTSDPNVPSTDWAANQRLHQYHGGHNETYDGVTINIDNDYLAGATAFGAGTPLAPPPAPSLRVSPGANGMIKLYASWPRAVGVTSWRTLGGPGLSALGALDLKPRRGTVTTITEANAFPDYAVQALGSSGQVLGTSSTVPTKPHLALYGHSVFVPARGLVGVPVGCFTGAGCRISLTVSAGRKVIARTGPEGLGSSGNLYFKLSPADRALLARATGRRLAVTIKARDFSGASVSAPMVLTPFTATGSAPPHSSAQSRTLRVIGLRDFAYRRAVGGILAGCSGAGPCLVKTTLTSRGRMIASTGSELLGANQAGYLSFRLTPYGRTLLANALGNQLGARVTITDGAATAHAAITLSSYS